MPTPHIPFTTIHSLSDPDAAMVAALRAQTAAFKGATFGPAGREAYDAIMRAVAPAPQVVYQRGIVGGVPGLWCRPPQARSGAAVLFLHGGGYVMGSAQAYAHFGGQFAQRLEAPVFLADYRLGPEHPFPAALDDAQAAYRGLLGLGQAQVAVVGDSAGGGLCLALLSVLQSQAPQILLPRAAVVMSPWTDLGLGGASMASQAADELYLTRDMLSACAAMYLGATPVRHPQASVLYAEVHGLGPLQIHVGTREILLDDSVRYAQRAHAAGARVSLHIWEGMPHVFANGPGVLQAADQALAIMADFLADHLR